MVGCASPSNKVYTASELVADAKSRIVEISVADVANKSKPILVDVREPYEFRRGFVPGAHNIPRGRLEWAITGHPMLKALADDEKKSAEIIVYCRSGARGALATDTLQKLGYTNVRSMQGGFLAWESAELTVEKPN
ncbi:MAG: rhodanese-like domain-containing protein [Pseudomonadota bacterium]